MTFRATSSNAEQTGGGFLLPPAAGRHIAVVRAADLCCPAGFKVQRLPAGQMRPEGRGRKPYSRRAERGTCRVIFGCHPFVGVRGGLREGRERVPLCFDPVQFAPLNFCGALRRWSFPSLVQPAKQSSGGFTVFFRPAPLNALVAHGQQRIERRMSWVTGSVSRVTKCL
jgi:hypothetical protein